MLEKINLFPRLEAVWEKKVRIQRLLRVGSVVVLVFYFVLLSSLFSYFLVLRREGQSLQRKIKASELKVKELEPVESKQVFLKSKLTHLVKIFSFEERPEEILTELETLAVEGISLSAINYQEEKITVSGEAGNIFVFDQFVKKMLNEGKDFFSEVKFESINKIPEGNYIFDLSLTR